MPELPDAENLLRDQYEDASNLNARVRLHAEFSTNKYGWCRWVFDQLQLPERCRVLEVGCGPGWLWKQNLRRIPAGWDITLSDFSPGRRRTGVGGREGFSGTGWPPRAS